MKCMFDKDQKIECPVTQAAPGMPALPILEKACPICPILKDLVKLKV